ncbi:MAG: hypothetical protein M3044_11125 [Thermoproteota archaeon]|nr:hypothetical protein [Thermoproteota archaeon]
MVSAKKVMVIGLMAVLGSSVLVGAVSLYNRSSSSAPTTIGVNQSELNARLNSILDFCLNSLPNGLQACDRQLKNVVTEVCAANNGALDACHNGKVDQYYVARAAGVTKSATNKTH